LSASGGPLVVQLAGTSQDPRDTTGTDVAPTKDLRSVESLDTIIANPGSSTIPIVHNNVPPGTGVFGGSDQPNEKGSEIPGLPDSTIRDLRSSNLFPDPPRPDPTNSRPRVIDTAKPLLVSSVVLQGKAVERVVPAYPELPKRIRLQGEVSLEVIISPEGRVESVRVVSGHPLLVGSAREAARGWRFEPTFLNGVPVRVTGVITFVFKLGE
jgi:TonB family protein